MFDEQLLKELKAAADQGELNGEWLTAAQIAQQTALFAEQFGPDVLGKLDGEALLQRMHGKEGGEAKCLAYWLEFKNDETFRNDYFGSIRGGSALKFGIFQQGSTWIAGPPKKQQILSLEDAIDKARSQRDELLAGAAVLAALDVTDPSDAVYAQLQTDMAQAAPNLVAAGWAHKYWFLLHPDKIDGYHSPRYQRFHLYKLLQTPPTGVGILNSTASRFVCAGRFVAAARELGVPLAMLLQVLNRRAGAFHRYWKVGTTAGTDGKSYWNEMHDGSFVSLGFKDAVHDLMQTIRLGKAEAKNQVIDWLLPHEAQATSRAGEIVNFAREIAEKDLVLACQGNTVLGVGRVIGPYAYRDDLGFPHTRPVEWLSLETWQLPEQEQEGLFTACYELGKKAANLLAIEQHVFHGKSRDDQPPQWDTFTARIEAILGRKGQVVLYGPPGTGKTYRALAVANELAARQAFRKPFGHLDAAERKTVVDDLVRVCTFHPGWGYEDFIEGLRPKTLDGRMVFETRPGVFKRLCEDAAEQPGKHFFLIIDEINRGDLPRIFGELLTAIELDKRSRPITLPITGEPFTVPANVFLIGTMNTADRSISLFDAALRRRFGFVELMPDSKPLAGRRAGDLPLGAWLDALNMRLRKHLKRDARNLQIGHAYLMPPQPIQSAAEFARILRDDIIPLLEEYCYEDFATLAEILDKKLVDAEAGRIREELFEPERESDLMQALWFEEMPPFVLAQERESADEADENDPEDASDAP